MFRTLSLLAPALIPSWRFFDSIAASPRIEIFTDTDPNWCEFRPRPQHMTTRETLLRLVYNPHWNESLYLVSCCERILESECPHAITQIQTRIERDVPEREGLKFRIILIAREGRELIQSTAFTSVPAR